MVKNRIIYALLAAACLAFSIAYTSKISAVLLIMVLLYPIAAALATVLQLISVYADFDSEQLVFDKNTRFEFFVNVTNNSIFPCVPAELVCELPDVDTGRFNEKHVFVSLAPFGSAKLAVEGRHLYRGCYNCTIRKIAAVDPLRIIRFTKKVGKSCQMIFLPRKIELHDIVSSSVGEQSFSRPNPITSEKEDFSHVREYRDGDIIQLVHWKLTAKQDELMIKQFDSINDRRALVLCDMSCGEGDVLLTADTIIETAISFVKALLDTGVGVSADFGIASEGGVINVRNKGDFEQFFRLMSVLPAQNGREDLPSLIDSADKSTAAVMVIITSSLSDEVILRARALGEYCAVYLAYVNLASKQVDNSLYEDNFLFLNIRGSGEDALKLAAAMAQNSQ